MFKTKTVIKKIALIGCVVVLAGCASSDGLEESVSSLSAKVDNLTNKVDALSTEVSDLKAQQNAANDNLESAKMAAEQAAYDARKANERIDNVVATYKK